MAASLTERSLHVPPFRRDRLAHAWIGVKALSDAGDMLWTIALAWTAVQIAGPAVAGLIVAAGTLPRAVMLLFGGAMADRYDTRRIIIYTNLVRTLLLVAVAMWAALEQPSIGLLLAAAIAFGVCDAIYDPAATTIARQLVRPEDLTAYLGVAQTASRVGTMVGAAAGGVLVAMTGLTGSASIHATVFFLVALVAVVWLTPRFPLPRALEESAWTAIRGGFRHLRDAETTRTLVIALSGLNLAVGPAIALGLPLRASAEGWGATSVGIFEALLGAGAVLGAMAVVRHRPKRQARAGFQLMVAQGVTISVVGLGPAWMVGASAFTIGVTAGAGSALLGAVFIATVDGAYLGRMVAVQRLGDDCIMPLTMMAFGALAGTTTTWFPFMLYGWAMVVPVLFALRNRKLMALA